MTSIAVVLSAAALVMGAAPATADPVPDLDPAKLTAAIAGLPNDEASGALLQVRGSAGEWRGTSGVANVHTGRKVPVNGRFRLGSITKTFTATAALQLVGKGRLRLDRTVQSYVPGVLPAEYPPITVDQLLTYTSGLPGIGIDHKDPDWFLAHRFDTWTPRQLFDLAFRTEDGAVQPMLFAPGTHQNYGNIDYFVLGAVIEQVTGGPYGDAVRDGIIRPLRLSATTVPGGDVCIRGPHARGYESRPDGSYVDITLANPTYQWAAAEMISNAPDLDRFLTALLSGRLLPKAQTDLLFVIPDVPAYGGGRAHYGHGIAKLVAGNLEFWGKTGDRPGYQSGMATTRDFARRVVYSVNTLHMGGELSGVTRRVIAAVSG